jgi:hypothetical protein
LVFNEKLKLPAVVRGHISQGTIFVLCCRIQSAEARTNEGKISPGSFAARAQSLADKQEAAAKSQEKKQ